MLKRPNQTQTAVWEPRSPDTGRKTFIPDDLQAVQRLEEKALETSMVLEANVDVLDALCKYYQDLLLNNDFDLRGSCTEAVLAFATQINDAIYDLKTQNSRAKLLARITSDRKSLVSLPSSASVDRRPQRLNLRTNTYQILQHLQQQATEKMEILTVNMQNIGVLAQKEAISMKVITVLTLVYLPATFVSVSLQLYLR